jgi:hypothetical protein
MRVSGGSAGMPFMPGRFFRLSFDRMPQNNQALIFNKTN